MDTEELDTFSLNDIIYTANQKSSLLAQLCLLGAKGQVMLREPTVLTSGAFMKTWRWLHRGAQTSPGPSHLASLRSHRAREQSVSNSAQSQWFQRWLRKHFWVKNKTKKTTQVSGVPIGLLSRGLSWLLEAPSVPGRGPSVEGQREGGSPGWAELRQQLLIKQEGCILEC